VSLSPPVANNTVRIFQTHNAQGEPAAAEYVQVIVDDGGIYNFAAIVMKFLAPLSPRQTQTPGVFSYTDPVRGAGWLRLEEFSRVDAARIQELVRMEEITAAVGPEPLRSEDIRFVNAIALRSHNPWVIFVFAAVLLGFSIAMFSVAFEREQTVGYLLMGTLFVALAIALGVQSSIRLRWWLKARRHARAHGGDLPSDLKGL